MMLWDEVQKVKNHLDQALSTCRQNGIKWAEAERNYRVAKAKKIMEYKSNGYPVTLIPDLVKGLDEIAELDFIRNSALVVYKANQEAILVKKLEMRTLESELEREYGNNE